MFSSPLILIHFPFLIALALFFDSTQAILGIFVGVPVVGLLAWALSFLISLFAWLTFFATFKILFYKLQIDSETKSRVQTPRRMKKSMQEARQRASLTARNLRTLRSSLSARYATRRAVIQIATLLIEMVVGFLPGYTLMVVMIYLDVRKELKQVKEIENNSLAFASA